MKGKIIDSHFVIAIYKTSKALERVIDETYFNGLGKIKNPLEAVKFASKHDAEKVVGFLKRIKSMSNLNMYAKQVDLH